MRPATGRRWRRDIQADLAAHCEITQALQLAGLPLTQASALAYVVVKSERVCR